MINKLNDFILDLIERHLFMKNKKSTNPIITILTFALAFMAGDAVNNLLGLNRGGILSFNTILSIIVLTVFVLIFEFLVARIRNLLSSRSNK